VAISNRKAPTVWPSAARPWLNQANSAAPRWPKGLTSSIDCDGTSGAILIGSGTNWISASRRPSKLSAEGKEKWVASIPSSELFEEQDASYRESVLRRRA